MNVLPRPDQVVSAASNVAHKVFYGGVADLRPVPRTLIDDGERRQVHHYRPATTAREQGDPVLLVAPLAAPALCYDLRRGCSLVEHFVEAGRPTYLVDYGEVAFHDRSLGMEPWVDEVVPTAIEDVSRHAGGRPVHVVGWSLGGIFALLTAADRADLPIASLAVLGAPVDVGQVPLVAPLRPPLNVTDGWLPSPLHQLMGSAPKPLATWAFQLSSFQRLITKPLAVATRLDDADFLAQLEAVDRFTAEMAAYPGRSFGQLYHRFVRPNTLDTGRFELGDRAIDLAAVEAPVLVCAGTTDGIAPVGSVKAVVPLLTGSREVRFEIVTGGHLGLLTGRAARGTTWPVLDEWVDQWSTTTEATPVAKKVAARKRTTGDKARKKAAADPALKKAARRRSSTRNSDVAAQQATQHHTDQAGATGDAIGANPKRRYGSAGSRGLAR